jgi:hypothetical protein
MSKKRRVREGGEGTKILFPKAGLDWTGLGLVWDIGEIAQERAAGRGEIVYMRRRASVD